MHLLALTCTDDVQAELKQIKDKICSEVPALKLGGNPKSPSEILKILQRKPNRVLSRITCDMIDYKIKATLACLAARKKITDECWGGVTDDRHKDVKDKLHASIKNLLLIKEAMGCK